MTQELLGLAVTSIPRGSMTVPHQLTKIVDLEVRGSLGDLGETAGAGGLTSSRVHR